MSEEKEEVLEVQDEQQESQKDENSGMSYDDGVIKVNLSELNKPQEDAIQEQSTDASDDTVGQSEDAPSGEEVVEEVRQPEETVEDPSRVVEEPFHTGKVLDNTGIFIVVDGCHIDGPGQRRMDVGVERLDGNR